MQHQPIIFRTPLALSSGGAGSSRTGRRSFPQTQTARGQSLDEAQDEPVESDLTRNTVQEQDEDDSEHATSLSKSRSSLVLNEDEENHLHFRRAFFSEADLVPDLDDLITYEHDPELIQPADTTPGPSKTARQSTPSPPPSASLQAAQRRAFLARKVVRASELTVSAETAVKEAETSFQEALQVIRVTAEDLAKAQVELNQARIGWMYYGAHKRKCEAEREKILAEIAELQRVAGNSEKSST